LYDLGEFIKTRRTGSSGKANGDVGRKEIAGSSGTVQVGQRRIVKVSWRSLLPYHGDGVRLSCGGSLLLIE
jgi:hypothetical protein